MAPVTHALIAGTKAKHAGCESKTLSEGDIGGDLSEQRRTSTSVRILAKKVEVTGLDCEGEHQTREGVKKSRSSWRM